MRVEAYNSVAQIYKTNRAAGASAAAKTEKKLIIRWHNFTIERKRRKCRTQSR